MKSLSRKLNVDIEQELLKYDNNNTGVITRVQFEYLLENTFGLEHHQISRASSLFQETNNNNNNNDNNNNNNNNNIRYRELLKMLRGEEVTGLS